VVSYIKIKIKNKKKKRKKKKKKNRKVAVKGVQPLSSQLLG
jgi:hypothetical protein